MIDIKTIKIGDKVCYLPEYENGIVKQIPIHTDTAIRVVFNCAGDWDNFRNYTSEMTEISDLKLGWI